MLSNNIQTPIIPSILNNSNISYPNPPQFNNNRSNNNPDPDFNYRISTSPNPLSSSMSNSNSISNKIPNLSSISSSPNLIWIIQMFHKIKI
jgi:hypothetical protein